MELGSISGSVVHGGVLVAHGEEKKATAKAGEFLTLPRGLESRSTTHAGDAHATSQLLGGSSGAGRNSEKPAATCSDGAAGSNADDASSKQDGSKFNILEFLKEGLSSLMELFKKLFTEMTNAFTQLGTLASSILSSLSQLGSMASSIGNPLSMVGKLTSLLK